MVTDHKSAVEALIPLVRQAAQLILEVYATDFQVTDKGGNDPVTVADKRANELLCEGISRLFPGVPIVAEESPEDSYQAYHQAPEAFFVDPLDGTREFVARNGQFVVMVGLAQQGRPTAGLVLAPTQGLLWTGALGHGAHEHRPDGSITPLHVPDQAASLTEARVVVSRSRQAPSLRALLERLPPRELLVLGSAGIKAAAVARGQADAYIQFEGAGCLWDACAPEAIITAAGGLYSDDRGALIDYRGALEIESGVIVAAPRLHASLVQAACR